MTPPPTDGGRRRLVAALVVAVVTGAVVLGPRPTFEEEWIEPGRLDDVSAYLDSVEAAVPDLRPGDQAGIVWADDASRGRTPVALVYLHGFSADRHEIEPVMTDLGRELGANVFFARLTGHGRNGQAMAEAKVEDWLGDVAEAVAVGDRIGDRVVLVGTSTGGTLATWAVARPESDGRVDAAVLISPNFQPRDRSSRMLLRPWGAWLARLMVGRQRCFTPENAVQRRHWTTCYPTSALTPMMALVEHVRTMELSGVDVPVLLAYSPDDRVVDAGETERVLAGLPGAELRTHIVTSASDPASHVLAGDVLSPDTNDTVRAVIRGFVEEVLDLDGPEPRG